VTCATITDLSFSVVNDLLKFSNLNKIFRILAYCFKFSKSSKLRPPGVQLFSKKIFNSLDILCIVAQRQAFHDEYHSLSKNGKVNNTSPLLSPFMDDNKLIRVGGRLRNAAII